MIWLYIVLAIIISLLIVHLLLIYFIFLRFFKRTPLKKIDKGFRKTSYSKPYAEEVISLREKIIKDKKYEMVYISSFDNLKLSAYYFNNNSDKTIIMVHGLRTHAFNNFGLATNYFLSKGYNVLAINQRGHEGSEGKYVTYGQKESKDVLSWLDYVLKNKDIKSVYLYGISMGATSVALVSKDIKDTRVKCLIIEDAYTSLASLVKHIVSSQHVPYFLFKNGVHFLSKRLADIDWENYLTTESLKYNSISTIFVHGTKDSIAINTFFLDNYNNCVSNKYQIIVEGAPHALSAVHDKNYLDKLYKIMEEQQ
ncbi:MAG: lysophospholipase [Bacilli bacterium]|nr:lysophospholipase [Bacilli bacterium]